MPPILIGKALVVISQLGFVDPEIHLDALEVTHHTGMEEARLKYPGIIRLPFH